MSTLTAPPEWNIKIEPHPIEKALKALASLRLTVTLLAMSIFLVFMGTLAQIDGGIWTIVRDYFRSFFVWIPFQLFLQLGQIFVGLPAEWRIGGALPFPGGWTLGTLLLINLVAAHATRFRLTWRRGGVLMLHAGVVILMLGELVTGVYQVEARMTIGHGETVNFTENSRAVELVLIDTSNPKENVEYTVSEAMLKRGGKITPKDLPIDLEVMEWMNNAELMPLREGILAKDVVTSKQGIEFALFKKTEGAGVDSSAHEDAATARIKLMNKNGAVIGVKLVSLWFSPNFTRRLPAYQFPPDTFELDGKTWRIELRGRREYLPFALRLDEFRFDRYPGTNTPRNFSSQVQLSDPRTSAQRDILIRMNEPLPYDGATYYQSGYTPDEKGTVLQVTRNPGVWMPYIACTLVTLGMSFHFGLMLMQFLTRAVRK